MTGSGGALNHTTRSLTEVFILMRNNAIQSKQIFASSHNHIGEDRLSLVPLNDDTQNMAHLGRIPPEWVNMVDEVQYEMSRIRTKLKELRDLENKHILRPNFDDDTPQAEKAIKALCDQIISMLTHCQRLIQHIRKFGASASSSPDVDGPKASPRISPSSSRLLENVVHALGAALFELTQEFRSSQRGYLRKLETREDNYHHFFDAAFNADGPEFGSSGVNNAQHISGVVEEAMLENGDAAPLTMAQLQLIDEQSQFVETREREVLQITKSIVELNTLFKDVGTLVADQGTVVDRIDYNIEQSTTRVKQGLEQVKKAEGYQKKNRKMLAIIVLSAIIAFLLIILILTKS